MHIEEAIQHRRSIRRYRPEPVPPTAIREMLTLATMAPSISNRQMWRFIVITDANLLRMLARLVERRIDDMATWKEFEGKEQRIRAWRDYALHFVQAPAVIAVINQGYRTPLDEMLITRGMRQREVENLFSHPDIQSVSAVIAYFTLLAEERGYGACWMTDVLIAKKDLQASLDLTSGEELLALVTVGKPDEYPTPKGRKPIDELIEWR